MFKYEPSLCRNYRVDQFHVDMCDKSIALFQKVTFYISLFFFLFQGIWHCYQEYSKLQGKPNSHLSIYNIGIQTDISMYFQLKQTWFTFSE